MKTTNNEIVQVSQSNQACCLCDISFLFDGDLWNGEQCLGSPIHVYIPLHRRERNCRAVVVNCSCHAQTVREVR